MEMSCERAEKYARRNSYMLGCILTSFLAIIAILVLVSLFFGQTIQDLLGSIPYVP